MASSDRLAAGGCAVVDIGKTHIKLLVIDDRGEVLAERRRVNASVRAREGYLALDTDGIAAWLCDALAGLGPLRDTLGRIIVTTHGAAFAALKGEALALPVPDYEFDGFEPSRAGWHEQLDGFEATLSPVLPRGLNAATQFDWLSRHAPRQFADADTLLPYAQYWAWWLSGIASSEVSSLGCHSQLWRPRERRFSDLADRAGWAERFAPVRPAWEVLGTVRPELAQQLGLRADLRVHCGVHDSNACLARYLRAWPRMTLVSTGTWVVVMAPGAGTPSLMGTPDLLGGVSVQGGVVPTGRFMGGRELQALCAGADPALADRPTLAGLLDRGVMALPAFEAQGGPFCGHTGCVIEGEQRIDSAELPAPQRATLAMLYCADVTAWLIERLQAAMPVVLEGPLASSEVFKQAMAALLPAGSLYAGSDVLEGTARGAWMLTRWGAGEEHRTTANGMGCDLSDCAVAVAPLAGKIRLHHARWRQRADAPVIRTS